MNPQNPTASTPHLTVLTTGGTIDKIYSVTGELEIGQPTVGAILEAATNLSTTVRPVLAVDSLDMTDDDRQRLVEAVDAEPADRVVITHGTDTMPETARFLLERPDQIGQRTIVLTGAMQPSAMRVTDAPFNVGAAVTAAQLLPAGVYVCMSGRIFDGATVRKDRQRGIFL